MYDPIPHASHEFVDGHCAQCGVQPTVVLSERRCLRGGKPKRQPVDHQAAARARVAARQRALTVPVLEVIITVLQLQDEAHNPALCVEAGDGKRLIDDVRDALAWAQQELTTRTRKYTRKKVDRVL